MKKGLILEKIKQEDWLFGADNGIDKIKIPREARYLPTPESQRFKTFDTWWCVIGSDLNILEYIFNYKVESGKFSKENIQWLIDEEYLDENNKVNFDDWFSAKCAGVIPGTGTTFSNGANAIRKFGLIPQAKSPFIINDFNNDKKDYDQPIPRALYSLGEEFNKRFKLNYEIVYKRDFAKALENGPIQVGVSNWLRQGDYYVSNGGIIHATMLYDYPWKVFDTYSPFIKQLADNYEFLNVGYQWHANDIKMEKKPTDKIIRLSNGALYWLKAGTIKAQKITKTNAGLATITHIMRKYPEDIINLTNKDDLKGYEIVKDFF